MDQSVSRRALLGAAAFTIVPRHVLGAPFTPPSDRITVGTIGAGRQGEAVTMNLLQREDVQVVAVCDVNRGSKDYFEYGPNALLIAARTMLGAGYEKWAEDLASPGRVQVTSEFSSSLGFGGREPFKRMVEAFYESRRNTTYKGCNSYGDYRELLEKQTGLDAVYIATPDHWHAPISIAAMRKKKAVLCQKPMAHSIGEARRMAEVARETKVATGLPVNNPSSENTRLIASWIADGAIGTVREVHNWSARPYWPQGIPRPKEVHPVPPELDWDMWVGPAPERPFNRAYLPFVWRGWVDFGCGSFGDMGCYSFAGVSKILDLTAPSAVEACTSESFADETYPKSSIVRLDYPAHNGRAALKFNWYDGHLKPARPAGLSAADNARFAHNAEGILYLGDKGMIIAGFNGDQPRAYPENPKYVAPPPARRGAGRQPVGEGGPAIDQWLRAIKGGAASLTNFEIQSPVTESFLLGCITQRLPGQRLEYDSAIGRFTNNQKANALIDPPARAKYRV
jgi:predicted dehydrogenase